MHYRPLELFWCDEESQRWIRLCTIATVLNEAIPCAPQKLTYWNIRTASSAAASWDFSSVCGLPCGDAVKISFPRGYNFSFSYVFLWKEKDTLQHGWGFLWWKNLKIPVSFSLACSFICVFVCVLCKFWPNFIALIWTWQGPWWTLENLSRRLQAIVNGQGNHTMYQQRSCTNNWPFSEPKLFQ